MSDGTSTTDVANALIENDFKVKESQLIWIPKNEVSLEPGDAAQVLKLLEKLEELDDVENVASNLEINEAALEAFGA